MELNMTLLSVIILFTIFAPIIYFVVTLSSSSKKVKTSFLKLSKSHEVMPNEVDIIGNLIIGIDTNSKKLIFSKKDSLEANLEIIDLSTLKDCKVKTLQNNSKTLDWVGLELLNGDLRKEIAFYIENNSEGVLGNPHVCLEKAKRWENSIRLSKAS